MIEWFREDNSTSIQTVMYSGILAIFGALFWRLKDRVGFLASALFVWSGASLVRACCFQSSPYQFNLSRYYLFSHSALKEGLCLLALAAVALVYRPSKRLWMALSILNSIPLLLWRCGAFYSDSMDASFIACTLPFFWGRDRTWKFVSIVPALAVIRSGSITGLLALLVSFLIWSGLRKSTWIVFFTFAFTAAFFPLHHGLTNTNGRIDHWRSALAYFFERDDFWLGLGTGTFSPHAETFWPQQRWLWAHNEFLQVFFEQGAVGLALLVAVTGVLIYRVRGDRELLASSTAYLFSMLALNPFRYLASALLGLQLLQMSCSRRSVRRFASW